MGDRAESWDWGRQVTIEVTHMLIDEVEVG